MDEVLDSIKDFFKKVANHDKSSYADNDLVRTVKARVTAAEKAFFVNWLYHNKLLRLASFLATKYRHGRNRLSEVIASSLSNMR